MSVGQAPPPFVGTSSTPTGENPFESVLRAFCIEAGLVVVPQVALDLGTGVVQPDLVCRDHAAEQVMLEPSYVRWVLAQVARRVEPAEVGEELARPA